jgi:hypothetical protein
MNQIVKPITPDGRTGFDTYNQLMSVTLPDPHGYTTMRMIADVRSCECYICGKGWGNTTDELLNQTHVDDRVMHRSCHEGVMKMNAYRDISNACIEAGFLFKMEEVPPRYPHSTPWQRITIMLNDAARSDSGYRLVIGRRKRVWELRLHRAGDLSAHFTDVDDTKGFSQSSDDEPEFGPYYYVHVWDKDQMISMLKRFHSLIPASISRSC